MSKGLKFRLLFSVLMVGTFVVVPGRLTAQAFTNLYSFTGVSLIGQSNSDGATPNGYLVLSGNTAGNDKHLTLY